MTSRILVRPKGLPSYPVWIGQGRLKTALAALPHGQHAVLIYDRKVAPIARDVGGALRRRFGRVDTLSVSGGEGLKHLPAIGSMASALTRKGVRNNAILFALGGGSVGDAVGFLASVYLRGVPWVSLPTTLLAQVDSSIGGKTAVNLREGKNLVGSFHHPLAVVCDPQWLKSLPRREISSALGEVLKYGLAFDLSLMSRTLQRWDSLISGEAHGLEPLIRRCLEWKAKIVGADPFEKNGLRRQLNLGHTFGHAIESLLSPRIRHGEAVFHGLHAALHLSLLRGHLKPTPPVVKLLRFFGARPLPAIVKRIKASALIRHIHRDKKSVGGRTTFILLKGLARPMEDSGVPDSLIAKTWRIL